MDINQIKPEYREELKGAMAKLFEVYERGTIGIPQLMAAQERLFDSYLRVSR